MDKDKYIDLIICLSGIFLYFCGVSDRYRLNQIIMKNKVFLIGNGINNINTTYTWTQLIEDLIGYIGATGQIKVENKPFPLLYEEIIVEAVKNRDFTENDIKTFIAKKIYKLESNSLHEQILGMGAQNILTSNYDLTFEKLLTKKVRALKNEGVVKENIYSVFRHYTFDTHIIWHIHGDSNYPSSIALGYEHYSGYLQQMRNYIASGTGLSYKNFQPDPLMKRLKSGNPLESYSWLDFFFQNDVYIIGLTLDFIEIHLWWLLTFRQRAILTSELNIKNKIFYFYPNTLANKIEHKLQLLKSYGIIPFSCKSSSRNEMSFYKNVLAEIGRGKAK